MLTNHLNDNFQNDLYIYISNHIQNDIIKSIHNVMIKTITLNIQNKFVSIIADETSDCSHFEQLSVVIRYFDEDKNEVLEQFIGLRRLVSIDAQSIFNSLTDTIVQIGLKWDSVIGVCFDGAASMTGSLNDVQA